MNWRYLFRIFGLGFGGGLGFLRPSTEVRSPQTAVREPRARGAFRRGLAHDSAHSNTTPTHTPTRVGFPDE